MKWAQWSACRPDVFPKEMCEALSQMHEDAPTHAWRHTASVLKESFQKPLEDLFVNIDRDPLASGSIAQV